MRGRPRALPQRWLGLALVAALALHELRCLLDVAAGGAAGAGALAPRLAVAGVALVAIRMAAVRVGALAPVPGSDRRHRLAWRLAALALAIVAVYLVEAELGGILISGQLAPLTPGGLCLLPLTAGLASLCLLADRWLGRLELSAAAAHRRGLRRPAQPRPPLAVAASPAMGRSLRLFVAGLAPRPPPLARG